MSRKWSTEDVAENNYVASRCRALIAAVFLMALRDLKPSRYRGDVNDMLAAQEWFEYEGYEPMSIRWCCDALSLDYEIVMMGYRFNREELMKSSLNAIQYVMPHLQKADEIAKLPKIPAWRIQANAERLERGMQHLVSKTCLPA